MTLREGTIDEWAHRYVTTTELAGKLLPEPPPERWDEGRAAMRLDAPGRPPELRVVARSKKANGLGSPRGRAHLLHTFLHHELQAAELMCWAILAFPETPEAFRRGLLRIALDEVRHMGMYRVEIERLGFAVGDFGVRDWFWERVPACREPVDFVAVMGMGLEAANLDHATRFEEEFRAAGDEASARAEALVGREEVAHVRFATEWFDKWTAGMSFERWVESLPPPLSPLLMKGKNINRVARARAGMPDHFLDELERWQPRGF